MKNKCVIIIYIFTKIDEEPIWPVFPVFILENELENYFTDEFKELCTKNMGKEEKPIYIVSQLLSNELLIDKLIDTTEYLNFLNHVSSK